MLVHVLSIVVYTQSTKGTIYFVHDIVEHPRIRPYSSILLLGYEPGEKNKESCVVYDSGSGISC